MNKTKILHQTIARAVGVSRSCISNIMAGRRRPSYRLGKKLSEVYGIDQAILFEGTPEQIRSAFFVAAAERDQAGGP